MITPAEKVDYGAFVSEKFSRHFWQKTFSSEFAQGLAGEA